jgi:DNA-binding IclR family transcriptional regulator
MRPALSATRATRVLDFLAAHSERGFTYTQLAQRLEINLASLHALLTALVEVGYLVRDPVQRTYSLGPVIVALGASALARNPAIDRARAELQPLCDAVRLGGLVYALAGNDMLVVARAGPEPARGTGMLVGQRVPLMAPLGAVFVAWAGGEREEQWFARTGVARNRPSRRKLEAMLAAVRERGCSVALEIDPRRKLGGLLAELAEFPESRELRSEMRQRIAELAELPYQLGASARASQWVSSLTAPVFDPAGEVELAITLVGFERPLRREAIESHAERLIRVAERAGRAQAGVRKRRESEPRSPR